MAEITTKAKQAANPWTINKKIRLDKNPNSKFVLAGVNGRVYQVPRGKEVEVPLPIYEQLIKQIDASDALDEMRDKIAKEAKEAE